MEWIAGKNVVNGKDLGNLKSLQLRVNVFSTEPGFYQNQSQINTTLDNQLSTEEHPDI